jgi:hypothetical protein
MFKLFQNENYYNIFSLGYFWRTTKQQEVDYLEEQDNVLKAFEF